MCLYTFTCSCINLSIHPSIYLSLHSSIHHLSLHPSIHPLIFTSFHPSLHQLYIHPFIEPSINTHPSILPSVNPLTHPSILHPSIHPFIFHSLASAWWQNNRGWLDTGCDCSLMDSQARPVCVCAFVCVSVCFWIDDEWCYRWCICINICMCLRMDHWLSKQEDVVNHSNCVIIWEVITNSGFITEVRAVAGHYIDQNESMIPQWLTQPNDSYEE